VVSTSPCRKDSVEKLLKKRIGGLTGLMIRCFWVVQGDICGASFDSAFRAHLLSGDGRDGGSINTMLLADCAGVFAID